MFVPLFFSSFISDNLCIYTKWTVNRSICSAKFKIWPFLYSKFYCNFYCDFCFMLYVYLLCESVVILLLFQFFTLIFLLVYFSYMEEFEMPWAISVCICMSKSKSVSIHLIDCQNWCDKPKRIKSNDQTWIVINNFTTCHLTALIEALWFQCDFLVLSQCFRFSFSFSLTFTVKCSPILLILHLNL